MKKTWFKAILSLTIILSFCAGFTEAADNKRLENNSITSISEINRITIPGNLEVILKTKENLTAGELRIGDLIELTVAKDVAVNGSVVIKSGSKAIGEVTLIKKKTPGGVPAQLTFQVLSINTVDDQTIPAFGLFTLEGKSKQGITAIATLLAYGVIKKAGVNNEISATLLASLAGCFIQGEDVYVPSGTELKVITQSSAEINISEERRG